MSEREDGILLQQHSEYGETRAHWETDDGGGRWLRFIDWWRPGEQAKWISLDVSKLSSKALAALKALLAQPSSAPAGDEHVDFTPEEQAAAGYSSLSGSGWTSCRLCGKVKPDGGWKTKCKGQTGIALRAAAPSPEGAPEGGGDVREEVAKCGQPQENDDGRQRKHLQRGRSSAADGTRGGGRRSGAEGSEDARGIGRGDRDSVAPGKSSGTSSVVLGMATRDEAREETGSRADTSTAAGVESVPKSESGDVRVLLREAGWSVAVHNDYRLNGVPMTFWLFTHPDGRYVKGEGLTDEEALRTAYRASLASPTASTGEARRQRFMAGLPSPPRPTEPVTFTPEEASALNADDDDASTSESVRSDGASEECTDCGASRYVFRVYRCGSCTCPMKTPAPVPASATPPTPTCSYCGDRESCAHCEPHDIDGVKP